MAEDLYTHEQICSVAPFFQTKGGSAIVSAVEYSIGGLDLKDLPAGPFITISNHPYGGADGLVLVDLFGHLRPDFKVMVNQILGMAKRMSCNMITVTPTGEEKKAATKESISGVKKCIEQIHNGGVLGLSRRAQYPTLSLPRAGASATANGR